jgi:hypothetical protein
MTEWPRIKGRKRWGGCDEVVLGDERARRGARSCWRGPSEYNGRSMECIVRMDGIVIGLGKHGVGGWKAGTDGMGLLYCLVTDGEVGCRLENEAGGTERLETVLGCSGAGGR